MSDVCFLITFIATAQQCIFLWFILRKQAISCTEFTANLAFICRKRELSIVMREAYRYCTNRVIHLNIYYSIIFFNSLFSRLQDCFSFLLFSSFLSSSRNVFLLFRTVKRPMNQTYAGKPLPEESTFPNFS